ncbi:hypothetical protein ACH42_01910 [Endozoicomonas sp. (ex Bugula neritina AB1)]|nr:hypothetical protein ACH42_01910 [Endozoicomonas sp. (ex Bugula neritina AB1)]
MLSSCSNNWNSPHEPALSAEVVYQTNFSLPPKHLDPATSDSVDESLIIDQVYEPLLGYYYLKRPYELEPLLAESMPDIEHLNQQGEPVLIDSKELSYTRYASNPTPFSSLTRRLVSLTTEALFISLIMLNRAIYFEVLTTSHSMTIESWLLMTLSTRSNG